VPWCELQAIHLIPCIKGDRLWCYHGNERPFDLAECLLVTRLPKGGDVEMNGLPNAEEDGLRITVSLSTRKARFLELEVS
jgi:hypothetical protein